MFAVVQHLVFLSLLFCFVLVCWCFFPFISSCIFHEYLLGSISTPDIAYDSFHMLDSDNTDLPHRLSEAVRLWLYYERVERKEKSSGGKIQSVQKLQKLQFLKWPFELQLETLLGFSHTERSVNPAVTTTHQGKGCNPKHDWHNGYFEGEDSQFPVCVTFPLPLSKLLASVCKQVSDCRKLLVTKGVCITLCDCGEGVVSGSAAAEGWWRIE